MTRAEELAEPHWGYIRGLMESTGVDQKIIDACAYVYVTAFIHGYKHAQEDAEGLAESHWRYIRGLLVATGVDQKIINACAYVYVTAFVHGHKHAQEDAEESQRVFSESGGLGQK